MSNESDYQYDAFISYSHTDKDWVRNELLPRLEAAGLKVIIDYRDFEIGTPSLVNMERAVDHSRHTLIVLTPAWIASEWTDFESLLAGTQDPAGRRRKIIPLMLKSCKLLIRIGMLTYCDFTDPKIRDIKWSQLLTALNVPPEKQIPFSSPPSPQNIQVIEKSQDRFKLYV